MSFAAVTVFVLFVPGGIAAALALGYYRNRRPWLAGGR